MLGFVYRQLIAEHIADLAAQVVLFEKAGNGFGHLLRRAAAKVADDLYIVENAGVDAGFKIADGAFNLPAVAVFGLRQGQRALGQAFENQVSVAFKQGQRLGGDFAQFTPVI